MPKEESSRLDNSNWEIQICHSYACKQKPELIKWICDQFFSHNKHFWELIMWSDIVISTMPLLFNPLNLGEVVIYYYPSFEDEEPDAWRLYNTWHIICLRRLLVELAYTHSLALEPTPLSYTDSLDKKRILLSWKPEFTVTRLSSDRCLEFCWQTWDTTATQLWLLCMLSTIQSTYVFSWNVRVYMCTGTTYLLPVFWKQFVL